MLVTNRTAISISVFIVAYSGPFARLRGIEKHRDNKRLKTNKNTIPPQALRVDIETPGEAQVGHTRVVNRPR
jgi:hypothetical protein